MVNSGLKEMKEEHMKCNRCGKPLKRIAWFFATPSQEDAAYCIHCAMHLSFCGVISAHGRPYRKKNIITR